MLPFLLFLGCPEEVASKDKIRTKQNHDFNSLDLGSIKMAYLRILRKNLRDQREKKHSHGQKC